MDDSNITCDSDTFMVHSHESGSCSFQNIQLVKGRTITKILYYWQFLFLSIILNGFGILISLQRYKLFEFEKLKTIRY